MATDKSHGSIILKILIVILVVILLVAIYVPKSIWDIELAEQEEGRKRLINLWTAETVFRSHTKEYTDSLEHIIALADTNTKVRSNLDSLIPLPLDSLFFAPQTGMRYVITLQDSAPLIRIACPDVDTEVTLYHLFKKKITNYGYIEDGKMSWE